MNLRQMCFEDLVTRIGTSANENPAKAARHQMARLGYTWYAYGWCLACFHANIKNSHHNFQ